jgi:GNAT superfamily N-acetyltransferase
MTSVGTVSITPVRNRRTLKRFVTFPWLVYDRNPHWVPPLIHDELNRFNPRKNPFHDQSEVQLFLAENDNCILGRIAAFVNRSHNQFHGDRVGFFGFFECLDDFSAARELFAAAAAWLKQKNMTSMRGPMNFSTNEVCGFLLKGFDKPPFTMMPYTPQYYLSLAEECGFHKAKDLYAYLITEEVFAWEKYERLNSLFKDRENVTVRHVNMKKWHHEIAIIRNLYNASWSKNWGFVPLSEAEFDHAVKQLKPIVDPRLLLILEVEGSPAGFSLTLPDVSPALKKANGRLLPFGFIRLMLELRKAGQVRVLLLAIRPEFQKRGLAGLLITETAKAILKAGYNAAEMSWTLEDNVLINKALERVGGEPYKKYRILEIPL